MEIERVAVAVHVPAAVDPEPIEGVIAVDRHGVAVDDDALSVVRGVTVGDGCTIGEQRCRVGVLGLAGRAVAVLVHCRPIVVGQYLGTHGKAVRVQAGQPGQIQLVAVVRGWRSFGQGVTAISWGRDHALFRLGGFGRGTSSTGHPEAAFSRNSHMSTKVTEPREEEFALGRWVATEWAEKSFSAGKNSRGR